MQNRVIHVKITSDTPEKLGEFYEDVFDWKIEKFPRPPDAWRLDSGDGFGINCSLYKSDNPLPSRTIALTVSVTSVDRAVRKILDAGGKLLSEKESAFGNEYVYCADPDGNTICIVEFGNSSN